MSYISPWWLLYDRIIPNNKYDVTRWEQKEYWSIYRATRVNSTVTEISVLSHSSSRNYEMSSWVGMLNSDSSSDMLHAPLETLMKKLVCWFRINVSSSGLVELFKFDPKWDHFLRPLLRFGVVLRSDEFFFRSIFDGLQSRQRVGPEAAQHYWCNWRRQFLHPRHCSSKQV